uniref:DUF4219 domain-containing protein n=1 Tax=Cuerna arida TaxID=1464854 RepID=A0A1B6H001_9HEMI
MTSTLNYRIDPLKKKNYDTWKLQAQAILIKSNLWKYVSGDEKCPDDTKEEEKKTWLNNDLTAKSDLILMISPGTRSNPSQSLYVTSKGSRLSPPHCKTCLKFYPKPPPPYLQQNNN